MITAAHFISPGDVIARLRTTIPSFGNRIAGASTFDAMEQESAMAVPAAFVMLGNNSSELLSAQTGVALRTTNILEVVLYLDPVDIRGQSAEDNSLVFKAAFLKYLAGWKPATKPQADELYFIGDQLHTTTRDRYSRIYQFAQMTSFYSGEDGYGMVGDYATLPDFDQLIGSMLVDIDGTDKTVGVQVVDIHEE